jgi:RHS repeat-associated protein
MYVEQDANFNVTALVDTSGNVQERYIYDPYGSMTILAANWTTRGSSSYSWVYGHQGGRLDNATGLYAFRNRDYSPNLGRWMENDPSGFGGGDTNIYGYEGENPTNGMDASGLCDNGKPGKRPPYSNGGCHGGMGAYRPGPYSKPWGPKPGCDNGGPRPPSTGPSRIWPPLPVHFPDGSTLITKPDGTLIMQLPDGSQFVVSKPPSLFQPQNPDGGIWPGLTPEQEQQQAWQRHMDEFNQNWGVNMLGPGGWWYAMWFFPTPGGPSFKPFEPKPFPQPIEPTKPVPELVLPVPKPNGPYLGYLKPGKNPGVYTVPNEQALNDLFSNLTKGGDRLPPTPTKPGHKPYTGPEFSMPDGSIIGKRPDSKSGGPTIDIKCPDGRGMRVHIENFK